jgi:hypothetical protein
MADDPPFEICSTTVRELRNQGFEVHMVLANSSDPEKMIERIEFSVRIGWDESPLLPEVQRLALRRARDVIGEQTQRLANLVGRSS